MVGAFPTDPRGGGSSPRRLKQPLTGVARAVPPPPSAGAGSQLATGIHSARGGGSVFRKALDVVLDIDDGHPAAEPPDLSEIVETLCVMIFLREEGKWGKLRQES